MVGICDCHFVVLVLYGQPDFVEYAGGIVDNHCVELLSTQTIGW